MTDHSSITSVTEEDDSDESDTTETSNRSKASDCVSSILYSSECNTDDKLTPSLGKISISRKQNTTSKKRPRESEIRNDHSCNETDTTSPPFPYGCNPLPFNQHKKMISQAKKKQRRLVHGNPLTRYILKRNAQSSYSYSYLPKQEEENFGIDDPNNYLYTDFSDTSSIPLCDERDDEIDSDDADDLDKESKCNGDNRPYLPNMRSTAWFHAKCFDHYWSHYNFVMDWYREHVNAVNMLSSQFAWESVHPQTAYHSQTKYQSSPKKKNSKRAKKRARSRRLAKAKQRAHDFETKEKEMSTHTSTVHDSEGGESEYEMEITEEMMEFMTTSFKHRADRDNEKNDDGSNDPSLNKMNKDMGASGQPTVLGPMEQPGVRRTAEMKTLYGFGSPMIHGMETALQMTYDKTVDRHQPKLWPNMPLKIVFAK